MGTGEELRERSSVWGGDSDWICGRRCGEPATTTHNQSEHRCGTCEGNEWTGASGASHVFLFFFFTSCFDIFLGPHTTKLVAGNASALRHVRNSRCGTLRMHDNLGQNSNGRCVNIMGRREYVTYVVARVRPPSPTYLRMQHHVRDTCDDDAFLHACMFVGAGARRAARRRDRDRLTSRASYRTYSGPGGSP